MSVYLSLAPLVALVAGILILVMPKLLNYIIAIYLIFIGLMGLFGSGGAFHLRSTPRNAAPFGLPSPVQASQPAAAEKSPLLPDVMSRNACGLWYSRGFTKPADLPDAWLMRAMQRGPQRRDRARATEHAVGAVDAHLVAGPRVGIAGDIGDPATGER